MRRQKSFTRHFFGLWGWLALGSLTVGAVFATLAVVGMRNVDRLANEGADATAVITDKRRRTDSDGDTDHVIRYRFSVAGETIEDRQDVSFRFYQTLNEGDAVPVRYWTGDPTLSEVEPGDASAMAWVGKIGTAVTALCTLIFARFGWRRAAHATWMARHGLRRQVTVLTLEETNVEINDVRQWKATWREADGREGATRMARHDTLPTAGTQITIHVDPEHRRDSIWEGDLLV